MSEVNIYFYWKSLMPDTRQYKQNGTVLETNNTVIVVPVPLTPEYIFNHAYWDDANADPNLADPQLTPAGMRYCINQLETVFGEPEGKNAEEKWEDEPKKTSPKRDEDWGAEFDEPDDTGKADNELWEDNEENWS